MYGPTESLRIDESVCSSEARRRLPRTSGGVTCPRSEPRERTIPRRSPNGTDLIETEVRGSSANTMVVLWFFSETSCPFILQFRFWFTTALTFRLLLSCWVNDISSSYDSVDCDSRGRRVGDETRTARRSIQERSWDTVMTRVTLFLTYVCLIIVGVVVRVWVYLRSDPRQSGENSVACDDETPFIQNPTA